MSAIDTYSHALEEEVPDHAEAGPSSMGDAAAALSLDKAFDIENTAKLILDGGYKTIGLQFPDELLPSSVGVYRALQRRIGASGAQSYVLADSTYGACCPDVLSCLHLPADLLVHYGHACLTPTDALPVHYVFPRRNLDVAAAATALAEASKEEIADGKKGVVVVWDVSYDWLADEIVKTLGAAVDVPVSFAAINRPGIPKKDVNGEAVAVPFDTSCASGSCATGSCSTAANGEDAGEQACSSGSCGTGGCGSAVPRPASTDKGKAPALRSIDPPAGVDMADCVLWYLGDEGRSLINLQMTHASNPLYAHSTDYPAHAVHRTTSRLLSRRLFALHQALAADVFGLVVGNIGLASSKPLVAALREALKRHQKKSYTLSVGRLNPAKLANFAEIECFVLIGCAEGGVVDSKDFLRPIITPYELTLALRGAESWDPSLWTLDLGKVLDSAQPDGDADTEAKNADSDEELEFSLVTGTYRTRRTFGAGGAATDAPKAIDGATDGVKDLTLRGDFTLAKLESAGSQYLASREFQGLEPRYGLDEPSVLEQGRSGIARGYTEEKTKD